MLKFSNTPAPMPHAREGPCASVSSIVLANFICYPVYPAKKENKLYCIVKMDVLVLMILNQVDDMFMFPCPVHP